MADYSTICQAELQAVRKADKRMWSLPLLSPEREAARKALAAAQKKLDQCRMRNRPTQGVLAARGLAQACKAAGVACPLKAGFEKKLLPLKADEAIKKAFRVKTMTAVVEATKKEAKKNDLAEVMKHTVAIEALNDMKKGTTAGFISAQVALAVVDVVAGIFSWGSYAAVAPFVHAAVGAGQKVSTDAINADISLNEGKLKSALQLRASRAAAKAELDQAKAEQKAAEDQLSLTPAPASLSKPPDVEAWYANPKILAGGGILLLGAIAATALFPNRPSTPTRRQ